MAREAFGNRFTFIAAGIGMAVGAGNIWRFPRVAAEFGGGTFLLVLLLANLVWAIPLLAAETLIGRKSRLGTVGAIRDFMGRKYTWVGAWVGVVTLGILFYYTVIAGWGFRYLAYSVTGTIGKGVDSQALWDGFINSPAQTILFEAIAVVFMVIIVYRGLKGGIEKVLQITLPALFIVLIILMIRALTLPGRWMVFVPLRPRMEPARERPGLAAGLYPDGVLDRRGMGASSHVRGLYQGRRRHNPQRQRHGIRQPLRVVARGHDGPLYDLRPPGARGSPRRPSARATAGSLSYISSALRGHAGRRILRLYCSSWRSRWRRSPPSYLSSSSGS